VRLALLAALLAILPGSGRAAAAEIKGDRALGEYLSAECVACHQLSGRTVGAIPAIVGLDPASFVAMMNAYRSKERENQVMRTIAAKFADDEIAALAVYFGSITPKPQ
jgi:cytochrome c553